MSSLWLRIPWKKHKNGWVIASYFGKTVWTDWIRFYLKTKKEKKNENITEPLVIHRIFKSKRIEVFKAFTTPELLKQWYSPSSDITLELIKYDLRVGGHYQIIYSLPDKNKAVLKGEFTTLTPPEELCMSWTWEHDEPHGISSNVRIQFIEQGDTTEVIITHKQLPSIDEITRHHQGWISTLERLDDLVTSN